MYTHQRAAVGQRPTAASTSPRSSAISKTSSTVTAKIAIAKLDHPVKDKIELYVFFKYCTGSLNPTKAYLTAYSASPIVFARKNTHANVVRQNVHTIPAARPTAPVLFIPELLFKHNVASDSKDKNSPCRNPHATKVQAAPCHRPEVKNTIIKNSSFFATPFRLPPSGI